MADITRLDEVRARLGAELRDAESPPVEAYANEPLASGGVDMSEDGIALAFAERYAATARYCHTSGAWYTWAQTRWRRDDSLLAFSWARDLCREANQLGLASLKKTATAAAVERAARSDRRLAVTSEVWDRDPLLLATPGGIADLRDGTLREALPEDYVTKQTAVAPGESAEPALWLRFLEQATCGDVGLVRFLQQIAGYALTGDVREHALFFVYGSGGNGKGVFVHTLKGILGGLRDRGADGDLHGGPRRAASDGTRHAARGAARGGRGVGGRAQLE